LSKGDVVTVRVDKVNLWSSARRYDVAVDVVRRNQASAISAPYLNSGRIVLTDVVADGVAGMCASPRILKQTIPAAVIVMRIIVLQVAVASPAI
jgi:hypothetical protein